MERAIARASVYGGYLELRPVPLFWNNLPALCLPYDGAGADYPGTPEGWWQIGRWAAAFEADYRADTARQSWGWLCDRVYDRARAVGREYYGGAPYPECAGATPAPAVGEDGAAWHRLYAAPEEGWSALADAAYAAWMEGGCPVAGPYSETGPAMAWAELVYRAEGRTPPSEDDRAGARIAFVEKLAADHPSFVAAEAYRCALVSAGSVSAENVAKAVMEFQIAACCHAGNASSPEGHAAVLWRIGASRAIQMPASVAAALRASVPTARRLRDLGMPGI